ncbi:protein Daple-like [Protopterus annectens]|uniref:protein Daple-like n=1 Tax=Protopterus annectens TaxID=7888 RepID=UPI001CF9DC31|nr:protein Daple-like [Protopterus annectens]
MRLCKVINGSASHKRASSFGSQTGSKSLKSDKPRDTFQAAAVKCVAGVPLTRFEEVTIDSDLDSVRTEIVREHFQKAISSRNVPSHSGKKFQSSWKETFRYPSSEHSVTDEEDNSYAACFTDPRPECRNSSPSRWSLRPKKAIGHTWEEDGIHDSVRPSSSRMKPRQRSTLEELVVDREILEESVAQMREELAIEEERLSKRQCQLREADQSLADILQKKKEAAQQLDALKSVIDINENEVEGVECQLRESHKKVEEVRAEMVLLECKRESCLKELQHLNAEVSAVRRQSSITQNSQLIALQNDISTISKERDELKLRIRHMESSLSFLERQELERQLNTVKNELFSEQRSARTKIEELRESVENYQAKMEEKSREASDLLEKSNKLDLQLREMVKEKEALTEKTTVQIKEITQTSSEKVQALSSQVTERDLKVSALERILSEKEMELLRFREVVSLVTTEKEAQISAFENLKKEHSQQLMQLQQEKAHEKEQELCSLRAELQCLRDKDLQELTNKMEDNKAKALKDQAFTFMQQIEKLIETNKDKDEEVVKLKEMIQSLEKSKKKLAEELKQEAKEMVQRALTEEQKIWEAEKEKEMQKQRETVEENHQRNIACMKGDIKKEKRHLLALQNKVLELQARIKELETENHCLQKEKQEAVNEVRASLNEEKQEEIIQIRNEMDQEKIHETEHLKSKVLHLGEELQCLRAERSEAAFKQKEAQAHMGHLERSIAMDISAECERLKALLQHTHRKPQAASPSHTQVGSPSHISLTVALQNLHCIIEELQHHMAGLFHELEAQRRNAHHLHREKERELKQQREQLSMEKEEALEVLKERLIQDHISEISNLQRSQLKDSGSSESQSVRQQLREKDSELRAIQRNMTKWKDETACKLARKFEEELSTELEK